VDAGGTILRRARDDTLLFARAVPGSQGERRIRCNATRVVVWAIHLMAPKLGMDRDVLTLAVENKAPVLRAAT